MLIDTHAHVYLDKFASDRDAVFGRARDAGVETIILPAIDVPSIEEALELAERYEGVYVMSALHPSYVDDATEADFEQVRAFCGEEKVIAVGESGLDYYWDRSYDEKQQTYFRWHIRLAIEQDLPLILHIRGKKGEEVFHDVIRLLEEERSASPTPERLRGIFHCFTGSAEIAEKANDLGFLVGLGGILTFSNSGLDEVAAQLPMEQIVLETDAPYLAPEPHRGKRNEPAYVRLVAQRLAEVRGMPLEEVAEKTSANARRLFFDAN